MEQKNYKNTLRGAVGTTFMIVVILLMIISNANKQNDTLDFLNIVILVAMVASAIWFWIKVTKQYIDFAIEEKDKDRKIMNIALQEKIKQLQEKDL